MGAGFDWSMGSANIDHETGIRYGVIHHAEVLQAWCDSAEEEYGPLNCGYCGEPYADGDEDVHGGYTCQHCGRYSSEDDIGVEEPVAWAYKDEGYDAYQGAGTTDIFILKSPYYTLCRFCSPCAPGAGYLLSTDEDGIRAYCFDHEWFNSGVAPYPVYRVGDDTLVAPPTTTCGMCSKPTDTPGSYCTSCREESERQAEWYSGVADALHNHLHNNSTSEE